MDIIKSVLDFILHLDVHLGQIIATYGIATYAILFVVIFVETGLVFMPFLPGDSLLFVAGAFAALGSLNIFVLLILLMLAAIAGDTVNYWIGRFWGEKIITNKKFPINEQHLAKTHEFFQKHGGKTIILARFVPIIRTFAPFVAGMGKMKYVRFLSYNVIGAVSWVGLGTVAGYFFGNVPIIKNNFTFFILAVVIVSLIPVIFPLIRAKFRK
ncbi:MAG: DedA family protein [Dehalococcoidia bacterium]|nr:MAG: DedA family protein [Dehalococcoidia bacterium]